MIRQGSTSCLFTIIFLALSSMPGCSPTPPSDTHFAEPLWAGTPPGSADSNLEEKSLERSRIPGQANRAVSQIAVPSLEVFIPENPSGAGMLICPGGAYAYLAYDKEGTDIARWLNEQGIAAFILKYRLPGEGHAHRESVPLQDAQRAMRLIRSRAASFHIDPDRLGVMGFSAGGHLASTLGTAYNREVYTPVDPLDSLSARPSLMVLIYPVISMEAGITHAGSKRNLLGPSPDPAQVALFSNHLQVTDFTPPAFIVAAADDKAVNPQNSLLFYQALTGKGVLSEIHIFSAGGHGFAMRDRKGPVSAWPGLCKKWLTARGFIE